MTPILMIASETLPDSSRESLDGGGWEVEEDGALGLRLSQWPQGLKQQRARRSRTMEGRGSIGQVFLKARKKLLNILIIHSESRIFTAKQDTTHTNRTGRK